MCEFHGLAAYTDFVRNSKPLLLGFGLIVLALAWYGLTTSDSGTGGAPSGSDTIATENAEQSSEAATTETPVRREMTAASIVEAASSESFAPPSEEDIACVQYPQPPYPSPMRDGRFEIEPVDQGWAVQTEATLWGIAGSLGAVKSIQCRTTFCVVTMAYSPMVLDLDPATRRAQARDKLTVLDDTMRALIANSNGRLGHYVCRNAGSPFEGFEFDFYVYGPPKAVLE
jgi:hypothetical protein